MGLMGRDVSSLQWQRFQRTYNWEIILPTILPIPGELVSQLVQSVTYSDYEMTEPAMMRDGAFQRFFAGGLTVAPFKITFMENELASVKLYLSAWKNAMLDYNGLYKKKIGGYAKDIALLYMTNEGIPYREVKFQNAFPLKFYEATLDYNSNEILKVTIPFTCDRVMEGLPGLTGIASSPSMGGLKPPIGASLGFGGGKTGGSGAGGGL